MLGVANDPGPSHPSPSSVASFPDPLRGRKHIGTKTLHVTYRHTQTDRGELYLHFRKQPSFDLFAFYDNFCFVRFTDSMATAETLLAPQPPGIITLEAAKQVYVVPYPLPEDDPVATKILHATHLPTNYTDKEMEKVFKTFLGFMQAHFLGKYGYIYFDTEDHAGSARAKLRKETNIVVSYAKNAPPLEIAAAYLGKKGNTPTPMSSRSSIPEEREHSQVTTSLMQSKEVQELDDGLQMSMKQLFGVAKLGLEDGYGSSPSSQIRASDHGFSGLTGERMQQPYYSAFLVGYPSFSAPPTRSASPSTAINGYPSFQDEKWGRPFVTASQTQIWSPVVRNRFASSKLWIDTKCIENKSVSTTATGAATVYSPRKRLLSKVIARPTTVRTQQHQASSTTITATPTPIRLQPIHLLSSSALWATHYNSDTDETDSCPPFTDASTPRSSTPTSPCTPGTPTFARYFRGGGEEGFSYFSNGVTQAETVAGAGAGDGDNQGVGSTTVGGGGDGVHAFFASGNAMSESERRSVLLGHRVAVQVSRRWDPLTYTSGINFGIPLEGESGCEAGGVDLAMWVNDGERFGVGRGGGRRGGWAERIHALRTGEEFLRQYGAALETLRQQQDIGVSTIDFAVANRLKLTNADGDYAAEVFRKERRKRERREEVKKFFIGIFKRTE
ncbi:hypothetical protein HDV00_005077 [Rhizophlyctis rosea]|nr:hypothetical protein HDV00_005077 [Rhizophlyctis rosea]